MKGSHPNPLLKGEGDSMADQFGRPAFSDFSITPFKATICRMLLRNEAHLSSKPTIDALRKLSSILRYLEQCTGLLRGYSYYP